MVQNTIGKWFKIQQGDKEMIVTIDRLKPAYIYDVEGEMLPEKAEPPPERRRAGFLPFPPPLLPYLGRNHKPMSTPTTSPGSRNTTNEETTSVQPSSPSNVTSTPADEGNTAVEPSADLPTPCDDSASSTSRTQPTRIPMPTPSILPKCKYEKKLYVPHLLKQPVQTTRGRTIKPPKKYTSEAKSVRFDEQVKVHEIPKSYFETTIANDVSSKMLQYLSNIAQR